MNQYRWRRLVNTSTVIMLQSRAKWRQVQGNFSDGKISPNKPGEYRKFFIAGCPRSGTTWIWSILKHHPMVISNVESHAYPRIFEPLLHGISPWRSLLDAYDVSRLRGERVGIHQYINRKAFCELITTAMTHKNWSKEKLADCVVRGIFDNFFFANGGTPAHVFAEKTPGHFLYGEKILQMDPEARLVEVVRDGRDVCVSMQMLALKQNWAPKDRKQQIQTWVQYVKYGMKLRSNPLYADRVLQVRYEAVQENPKSEIERLFTFSGLKSSPDLIAEIIKKASFKNQSRKTPKGPGEFFRKGVVGDWQNHFSQEDHELFRGLVGDLFNAAGYVYE